MKVLFDHQIFEHQRIGGISRYFSEIFNGLPNEIDYELALHFSNNIYLNNLTSIKPIVDYQEEFLNGLNFPFKRKIFNKIQKINKKRFPNYEEENLRASINALKKQNFEVFHPTYYIPYFLDYLDKKPFVLTVHDLTHEIYPEYNTNNDCTLEWKRNVIKKAAHIIAVSENTKRDIVTLYNIDEKNISTIHHGFSSFKKSNIPLIPDKYLLFVGDRSGYKNFLFLLLSIEELLKQYNIKLFCTGKTFTDQEKILIKELELETHVIQKFVSDDELYSVYTNSLAFIFPSLYEGFGFPILEAFYSNCPVLLADSSCFKEIAGDAALYFSPKKSNEIKDCVEQIINNQTLRNDLIEKGKIRLQDYNWKTSIAKHIEIYKQF